MREGVWGHGPPPHPPGSVLQCSGDGAELAESGWSDRPSLRERPGCGPPHPQLLPQFLLLGNEDPRVSRMVLVYCCSLGWQREGQYTPAPTLCPCSPQQVLPATWSCGTRSSYQLLFPLPGSSCALTLCRPTLFSPFRS